MTSLPLSRRRFLQQVGGFGAAALAADSIFWEPYHPRVVKIDVPIPNLPDALDGFTIAQLSDLHYDPTFGADPIKEAVEITNSLSPQLVALTGDFVSVPLRSSKAARRAKAADAEPCADLLTSLNSPYGSFAVLGNHDAGTDAEIVTQALERRGIPVLHNRAVPIEHAGSRFWLAGVGDVMEGKADLDRTLRGLDRKLPTVLMAHEPDFADRAARYNIELQLSGHSHGGQVCLPLVGALYLPPLARKYPWGLRSIGKMVLYTNVGIGTIHIPVRLSCRPEVTLVTLKRGEWTLPGDNHPPA